MDEKEHVLQEIQRVASTLAPERLTQRAFQQVSPIPLNKVHYYFGTWNNAVKAAGLEPNPSVIPVSGYKTIAEEDLLAEIGELWKRIGRRPTISLMNSMGKYSERPYRSRWGKFSVAVDEYIRRFGVPSSLNVGRVESQQKLTARHTPLVIPKTYKPKSDVKASRELGFLIESTRTDLPDCEGKRCLDSHGTKWQHVRIEFEYRSSNFSEHGNNPEACDLIVSWLHDWEDCPLEVLELPPFLNSCLKSWIALHYMVW